MIHGNQNIVSNETTTPGYGRLTGWIGRQRLYSRGRRGREHRRSCRKTSPRRRSRRRSFHAGPRDLWQLRTSQVQHTASRRHGNAGQQRGAFEGDGQPTRGGRTGRGAARGHSQQARRACGMAPRPGPRTTVLLPNEDDKARDDRRDEGEDGIVAASRYGAEAR
ncbi:hypothetical protein BJ912DRAFT_129777 [Pholiota molesta]|nr:hypothetical protein BJ912DRAFT_129777 [Pholiota molesta]